MAAAASPLSIGATALTGFGKVLGGVFGADASSQQASQQAQMDQFQAQRLADAQQYGMAQADQADSAMRAQLHSVIGRMMTTVASANTDLSSPTAQAVFSRAQGVGDQQRTITVGNLKAQAAESGQESQMYTTAAQQTLAAGQTNALASLFGGLLGGGGSLLDGISGLKLGVANFNSSLPNNKNGGLIGFG